MNLTIALSILGALLIVALLFHGCLVGAARDGAAWLVEAAPAGAVAAGGGAESDRREPSLDGTASAARAQRPRRAATRSAMTIEGRPLRRRLALRLDALIDAIAPLRLEAPISAELALTHLPPTRRAGSKPFMIEGLNAETGEWESPAPGQRYGEFQAGVQLANRGGALNEIEYSEFVQKIERFAEGIGATADAARHARRGGARARARRLRRRARCAARAAAACARRRLVGRLPAAAGAPATASSPAWCRAG